MPSMREIEALARPPPPQQPEPFTFQPLIFRYDGPPQPEFPTFRRRSPPHFGSWTLPAHTQISSPTITRTPPSRNQQGPTRIQRLRLRMRRFISLLLCVWPLESVSTFIKAFVFWIEVNVYSACTGYLLLRCGEVTPNTKSDIDNKILKLIY